MIHDPTLVRQLALKRRDENWRFRSFLKMLPRRRLAQINRLAEQLGRAAEVEMDCRTCGACCQDNWIPVNDEEAARLADGLSLPVLDFRQAYLTADAYGEIGMDARPCRFLDGTTCSVYANRPDVCRGYPYMGGDIASRMIDIIERGEVCPIVFEMIEGLKRHLGFGDSHR